MLKKNIYIKCLGTLFLGIISSSAFASKDKFYVSVKGGYSALAQLSSKAQTGKIEGVTGLINNKPAEQTVKQTIKINSTFNSGILFGKNFGMYRLEGEFNYLKAKVKSLRQVKTYSKNVQSIYRAAQNSDKTYDFKDTTFSVVNIGLNGYYDVKTPTPFTPYVGLGIGTSIVTLKTKGESNKKTSTLGAFQAMLGSYYHCTKEFSVMLEYRFSATSQFAYIKLDEDSKKLGFKDYKSSVLINSVNLGVKYTFA